MTMQIMFCNDPKAKYKGRIPDGEIRTLPVAPVYEHAIETRSGIFIETYRNIGHGLSQYRMMAVYQGVRRSVELPRRFDPRRLETQ